jgi:hypothetical protein
LRDYINDSYETLRIDLTKLTQTVTDKTTQIKLSEVITFLKPLDKKINVKDDHIMALLQYHQLVSELKSTK